MAITVDIVSRETVKPSTPTPAQLRSYKLSWIDQNHPIYHLPVVFFYSATPSSAPADVTILKSSLSTVLASFYPLAGRLTGNSLVDCGDQGVEFFEALAPDADLSEILSSDEPNLDELKKFLPCSKGEASCCDSEPTVILSVQATVFRCGGIAVGVCVSHKIADGRSLFSFLQGWAAAARGSFSSEYSPSFDGAAVFPPNENAVPNAAEQPLEKPPQVHKRFVLSGPKIAALREKTASSATRFLAVAALVWRCAVRMRPVARVAVAVVVADTRSRMELRSPNGSFGNCCTAILVGIPIDEVENIAKSDVNENTKYVLEEEMGAAVKRVDTEYVRRLQGEDGWQRELELGWEAVRKCGGATEAGFEMNVFSSWLRLPVYGVDFGWGPAAWACMTRVRPSTTVVMPRPPAAGDPQGMEVWASLEKDEMAELQRELDKLVPLNTVHHVTQP
ncbi:salutaridinol 7-O-acetyltransferase-like [Ananas comosus]|uniref:Salutaridinol 7-O-acetyltransferase-like n=1 Tax=Ananas comosus TaxID=4615 RepID=A0A6P5GUB9_ANACO|nr:salutaridinol 7-O-acetyltransferase-like [Ananas comosus]